MLKANYITWSLSVGQRTNLTRHRRHVRPSADDLQVAKTNLLKMDYLLDLSYHDKRCMRRTMKYLKLDKGVSESDAHANKAWHPEYADDFRREDIALLNSLDTELYTYAMNAIDADCRFFALLENNSN